MKAVQCTHFGDIDQVMSVEDSVPKPSLSDVYDPVEKVHPLIRYATRKDRETHMIIKTLAVALAPGDCRVLSGKTRRFQGPPSFPYIPGGDCCGIVVDVPPNETYFQPGDVVAARFTVAPRDALAEYARVSTSVCEKVDPKQNLSPAEAAVLASASPAVAIAEHIRPEERVLVLGAGGGVGSHLCQLLSLERQNNCEKGAAGFVCGVSADPERLLKAPLRCDRAIDYRTTDIFTVKEFQDEPFDTVVDLACGGWPKLLASKGSKIPPIVKPASQGGRFLTVTPDHPTFQGNSFGALMNLFMFKPLFRYISSRLPFRRRRLPAFTNVNGLVDNRSIITKTLNLAYHKSNNSNKLEAVIHNGEPYPMTTEGVRKAFRALKSRHAKGKVVIQVQQDSNKN